MNLTFLFLAIPLVLMACDNRSEVRLYNEMVSTVEVVNVPSTLSQPSSRMDPSLLGEADVPNVPLRWQTPEGWAEQKGNGLRLATFTADGIECSIVILGGSAGGLIPNIGRWMQQVNLPVLSGDEMAAFVDRQRTISTAHDNEALVVDLTSLHSHSKPSTPSILAAVIQLKDAACFIKMTGTIEALQAQQPKFIQLIQSIHE